MTIPFEQHFAFDPYPGPHAATVNKLLQTVARGSGKLRVFTSYTLQGQLEVVSGPAPRGGLQLRITAGCLRISGDVSYRDFSLKEVLMPDRADLVMSVYGPKGELQQQLRFDHLTFPGNGEPLLELVLSGPGLGEHSVIDLNRLFVYYDQSVKGRLESWDAALRSYYEAPGQLAVVSSLLDGLDPANPETLIMEEFRLCEAEALLAGLRHAPFHQWLDPERHDPEGNLPAIQLLEQRAGALRLAFNQGIQHIDSLFYRHGRLLEMAGNYCEARQHYLSALNYNPFHIPSQLALTREHIRSGEKEEALERLGKMYSLMCLSPAWKQAAAPLTGEVLDLFFDESRQLIADNRLTASLNLLSEVEGYCLQVAGHADCPPELEGLLERAHRGMYLSFLVVAERALQNDDLGFAGTYLEYAIDYQQSWAAFVPQRREALDMLFRLLTRYREKADLFRLLDDAGGNDHYVVPARELCLRYPDLLDHVAGSGERTRLQTAVMNYAVAGFPEASVLLLRMLKEQGLRPSETTFLQELAGVQAANQLRGAATEDSPGAVALKLTDHDPWFRHFVDAFIAQW